MRKPLVLVLLAALMLSSGVLVATAQEDTQDPRLCSKGDGSGVTCGVIEDNECYAGALSPAKVVTARANRGTKSCGSAGGILPVTTPI